MILNTAGHDRNGTNPDPGATGYIPTLHEADKTIEFRDLVTKNVLLQRPDANIKVDPNEMKLAQVMTTFKPGNGSVCNEWHFNAADGKATGVETMVAGDANDLSKQFAEELGKGLAMIFGLKWRRVMKDTETPRKHIAYVHFPGTTCLTELCFIDNPEDMAKYEENKEHAAAYAARILLKYEDMIK